MPRRNYRAVWSMAAGLASVRSEPPPEARHLIYTIVLTLTVSCVKIMTVTDTSYIDAAVVIDRCM